MTEGRPSERKIGRYALYGDIASGGMATVYFGRLTGSAGFARTVAIKRLHPHFAKDPEFVAMFLDEARLAARIKHPNVVPIVDVISEKDETLIVMEYVHGESLSRLLLQRSLGKNQERAPLKVISSIVCSLLHGLHAAHEALDEHGHLLGIVHRDVSPQNVLVGADGTTRVLDFGVAKAMGRAQVTRDGQLKGKFAYMAPEQLQRAAVDRRADVFASAVVLWEMLTLRRLFDGDSELAIIAQITMKEVPALSTLGIDLPPALEAVVMKGLAKNPEERYQTAREMAMALEAAMPPASAWEVAEWISTIAKDALSRRERQVQAIERSATEVLPAEPASPEGAAEGRSQASVTRVESAVTNAAPAKSNLPLLVFAFAALLAIGLGAFFALKPSGNVAPAATNAMESAPASTPVSAPASASASASASAPVSASASASAPAPAPVSAPAPASAPASKAPTKTTKPSGCNPPYTIDAKGIRRMKPECL